LKKHAFSNTVIGLAIALAVVFISAVAIGAVRISSGAIIKILLHSAGILVRNMPAEKYTAIVMFIRMPRVVAAMLVGASLATAGAATQGLFRNPMASPDILGISAGGSLGAVIAIHTGLMLLNVNLFPLATIAGSLIASFSIYAIASYRGVTSLLFVVIAGMAISSFLNGLISAVLLFSKEYEISQFIFWTMGGLDGRRWDQILLILPFLLPALGGLFFFSRELNILMLGEENALSTGINVELVKKSVLSLAGIVTGLSVAISGTIGFVGLLIPHFFRLLFGSDYRKLMPLSALGGAVFLVLCDLLGRSIIPPFEIRVGIITSVIGAPYLIFLIIRYQRLGIENAANI